MIRVLAARVGPMMERGPISQPTRHPVAANASDRKVSARGIYRNTFALTAGRHDCHSPVPHARKVGNADMFFAIIDETIIL